MFKKFILPVLKNKKSWPNLILTLVMALAFIGINVVYVSWVETFMNAFESKDFYAFKIALLQFVGIGGVWIITYGYRSFFRKKLSFVFREIITESLLKHYKIHKPNITNLDQRLAEDPIRFSELITSLSLQALSSLISLPIYLYWLIVGTPWYVSVLGISYAIITTLLARRIALPLQKLDYEQQTREANYRYKMVQIRDGKEIESPNLEEIKINWLSLAKRAKILSFFQSGQNLASNILPLIMLAPAYFLTGNLTIGALWKIRSIWAEVLDALSFFVNTYDSIAEVNANAQRMSELVDNNETQEENIDGK